MRIINAVDIDPRAVQPGDVLLDLQKRMYLVIGVELNGDKVRLFWFRNDRLNVREYT